MKLVFFLYCALGPLLKKAQGLLAWRAPVTQAATWVWAAKSARARHPPGPRSGPTARPPASVRFHPTAERRFRRNKIAGGRRFSSQTLGHFALSFPVSAGGGGAPPSLLGPAVGAMAVRSPRSVRSLFSSPSPLFFFLEPTTATERRSSPGKDKAAPPRGPSPARALVLARVRRRRAALWSRPSPRAGETRGVALPAQARSSAGASICGGAEAHRGG